MRTKIKELKDPKWLGKTVTVKGWIRTVRSQKSFTFLELNDGSTLSNLQVIVDQGFDNILRQLATGASMSVVGSVVQSPGGKQQIEVHEEQQGGYRDIEPHDRNADVKQRQRHVAFPKELLVRGRGDGDRQIRIEHKKRRVDPL